MWSGRIQKAAFTPLFSSQYLLADRPGLGFCRIAVDAENTLSIAKKIAN